MRWYLALNGDSIQKDPAHARCVEVALLSALKNTSLRPTFLFDGPECDLTRLARKLGAEVIFHRSSLHQAILDARPGQVEWQNIAHGAFLRLDIPDLDHVNEFVLYTDCDVMFRCDPAICDTKPRYFAVAPEFTRGDYVEMNSGVMIMNLPALRAEMAPLKEFIAANMTELAAYDQTALRMFFAGRYEPLPETLNWKPYWGLNPEAEIIHYHGPKPTHVLDMIGGKTDRYPPVLIDLFKRNVEAYSVLTSHWELYSEQARAF